MAKSVNTRGYRKQKELDDIEKARIFNNAFETELAYAREHVNDIVEIFDECMRKASVEKDKYKYCFDVLGIKSEVDGKDKPPQFYNRTILKEVNRYASKYIDNVFPEGGTNFTITAKDECVELFASFYENMATEEIRNQLNSFLQILADTYHEEIENSNFYQIFFEFIKETTVRQGVLLVQPSTTSIANASIVFERVFPFSVAHDYNKQNEVIGVYRKLKIRVDEIIKTYPDYNIETLKDLKPRDFVTLKECCFYKHIDVLQAERWVYLFINEKNEIVLMRLLEINPFITVCETLPNGSNVGRGKVFDCYEDILKAEENTKRLSFILKAQSEPPTEVLEDVYRELKKNRKKKIEPGDVIPVKALGSIHPVNLGQSPESYIALVQASETNISNAISGEMLTTDPNATATLTTVQMSQMANFIAALQGKMVKPLVFQLISKVSFFCRKNGIAAMKLRKFLLEDTQNRLPATIFTDEVMFDAQLMEDTLSWYIETLLDAFGKFGLVNINILSKIGMRKKLDDLTTLISGLQSISGLTGMPSNVFVSEDKLVAFIREAMGLEHSVFLNAEEKEEKLQRMAEQQAAAAQQQAAAA